MSSLLLSAAGWYTQHAILRFGTKTKKFKTRVPDIAQVPTWLAEEYQQFFTLYAVITDQ